MKKHWNALLLAVLVGWCGIAQAASAVFVQAPSITDMAHDFRRGLIYIANGNRILRYSVASRTFLSSIPISAGTQLKGMDISADGSLLAVADAAGTWVYLVNLNTLGVTRRSVATQDGGTWSVAFAADNTLLASSGNSWVPLRRLNLATGAWTDLILMGGPTMLSASADRKTIAYAEGGASNGPWGLYDVPTRQFVIRNGYADGTSGFNFEVATDALGSQFTIPTYNGTYVFNDTYQQVHKLGGSGGGAIGVAYHPVRPLVYLPWVYTGEVRVFNLVSGTWAPAVPIGDTFGWIGNWAYQNGRIKLSADGSLLMVTVAGGLRFVEMYAPLRAAPVAATVSDGVASPITLQGSIGNAGALTYVVGKAQHGTVTVSGKTATYTAAPGYSGSDSFLYQVRYGAAAVASATVRVTVQ